MFANDITLNPQPYGGANADKVFSLVGWGGDSSSIRRVSATASTAPDTLKVSHRETKQGKVVYDDHMVRRDLTVVDPILGPVTVSAWIVVKMPRGTSATVAQAKNTLGEAVDFLMEAGATDKFLNSEP